MLNYRVGDKIVFKNTADPTFDYLNMPNQRWASLSLSQMPQGALWESQGQEISFMTPVIDWDSASPDVLDWTGISVAVYKRDTPITSSSSFTHTRTSPPTCSGVSLVEP